ncbi:MAG: redox-sensing transcriptional repressor Rex [bacterium (Candidatus Stahlbacteria) CG23_combo_of_CG06-09_8_20_14_all_34_7]|nr:MAG: redox-sensing transcriptional repressor Rex [bacterium (Candidatus Stahlbacteria) CG23_combo_of_CG06-09_8_20_14_all_34_7]
MKDSCKNLPKYTLKRLTDYLNVLYVLKENQISIVSSCELAKIMNITDVQIRKDLSCFVSIGKRGVGYDVEKFIKVIEKELYINRERSVIIIGAGRLGTAFIHYKRLSEAKFKIKAAFDISKHKINKTIKNIKIYHVDELEKYLSHNEIDIAILTIPASEVSKIFKIIKRSNIKAILNFTASIINETENIIVRNLDILSDFKILSYKIKEKHNAH